jgi:signal transduction histidine kinase
VPHIWRTLRLAGLALAGYAVFGGLFVPPGHFFPANWLNSELLEQWTLVPVQVYRGGLGLILALAIIRALVVFRVELDRRLGSLEEAQVLIAERERIGRELHDGTLQTIYAAGLLLRTSEKEMRQQDCPERSLARVQQSVSLLDEAVSDIRSYIGSLRSQPSSRSLASSLRELALADHLRSLVEVNLAVNLPEDQPLSPAQVGHLLAITNEAISNVVRHAQARQLFLTADLVQNQLVLKIEDNGQGLPHDYVVGYGLRNMRDRARMLGGEMTFVSKPGQGATVTIIVPWDEHDEQTKDFVG